MTWKKPSLLLTALLAAITLPALAQDPQEPKITITPTALTASHTGGQSTSTTFTISNEGDTPLTWDASTITFGDGETANPALLDGVVIGFYEQQIFPENGSTEIRSAFAKQGATVRDIPTPFTPEDLEGIDILWLSELLLFSELEETNAIEALVNKGAGLYIGIDLHLSSTSILDRLNSGIRVEDQFQIFPRVETQTFTEHPITDDISSLALNFGSADSRITLSPPGRNLVSASASSFTEIIAASSVLRAGRVVVNNRANVFSDLSFGSFEFDNQKFALQIASWLSQATPEWLTLTPASGSISAGESMNVEVTLDSTVLSSSELLTADISISSNDPTSPETNVAISLNFTGTPEIALSPNVIAFEGTPLGGIRTVDIEVLNPGSAPLTISSIGSSAPSFSVDPFEETTIRPKRSVSIPVHYSPDTNSETTAILTIISDATNAPEVMIDLSGNGLPAPEISISPPTLAFTSDEGAVAVPAQSLTITNNGDAPLTWSSQANHGSENTLPSTATARGDGTATSTPLARTALLLDALSTNVTSALGDLHPFPGGESSNIITTPFPGPYSRIGNWLRFNRSGSGIPYSDREVTTFGSSAEKVSYFTAKFPGLFVFAADMGNQDEFYIGGEAGSTSRTESDGVVLSTNRNGTSYLGFVHRIYGGDWASINHLVIVPDNGTATHTFATDLRNVDHRITGLQGTGRLYHLLFAGKEGRFITDEEMRRAMETFLDIAGGDWLNAPSSGTIAAGGSASIPVAIHPAGLLGGNYTAAVQITSNDPVEPQVKIPVTLNIQGTPAAPLTREGFDGLHFGEVVRGTSRTLALSVFNPGTAPITISGFSSENGAFSADNLPIIPPLRSGLVHITFSPAEFGSLTSAITLTTSGGDLVLPVSGSGATGALHTFRWEAVPSPQAVNTPIETTITAIDIGGNTVTTFQEQSSLFAFSPPINDLFQAIDTSAFVSNQNISSQRVGNVFTPDRPLTITEIQVVGDAQRAIFWNSSAEIIRSVTFPRITPAEELRTIRLDVPLAVPAGESFLLTADSPSRRVPRGARIPRFPHGTIDSTYTGSMDDDIFPQYSGSTLTFLIGFSYVLNNPEIIPVFPGETADFTDGSWTGNIAVETPGADAQLVATGAKTLGLSNGFEVTQSGTFTITLPTEISEAAGTLAGAGTLTLDSAAETPLTFTLFNSSPGDISIPATIDIEVGETSASFDITAQENFLVDGPRTAEITARSPGYGSRNSTISIMDDEMITFTFISPTAVIEGDATRTIATSLFLSRPANYDITFTPTSSNHERVSPPRPITLSAGNVTLNINYTFQGDNTIGSNFPPITLGVTAPGHPDQNQTLTIIEDDNPEVRFSLATELPEDDSRRSFSLFIPGTYSSDLTVALSSSSPLFEFIDETVTIPAGSTSLRIAYNIVDDAISNGRFPVTVTASTDEPGFSDVSKQIFIIDNDPHHFRFSPISQVRAGVPQTISVRAENPDGTLVLNYREEIALTAINPEDMPLSVSPSTIRFNPSGIATFSVTLDSGSPSATLVATNAISGATGRSNTFAVIAPTADTMPEALHFSVREGEVAEQNITINNTGTDALNWYTTFDTENEPSESGQPPLSAILTNVENNNFSLSNIVPGLINFQGGETGTSLESGDEEPSLFASANRLSLRDNSFNSASISYQNNQITSFENNIPGNYFTQKLPGLFFFAGDVPALRNFEISGTTSFPSSTGAVIRSEFSITIANTTFQGYLRQSISDNGTAIHQIFLLPETAIGEETRRTSGSNAHLNHHRIHDTLEPTRLYHLLFATLDTPAEDVDGTAVAAAFLNSLRPGSWFSATPESGKVPAGVSSTITASVDSAGLAPGSYEGTLIIRGSLGVIPDTEIPVTLDVMSALDALGFDPLPTTIPSSIPIPIRLTAQNLAGETLESFSGSAEIDLTQDGITVDLPEAMLSAGVYESTISVLPGDDYTLTATVALGGRTLTTTSSPFSAVSTIPVIAPLPAVTGGVSQEITFAPIPGDPTYEGQASPNADFSESFEGSFSDGSISFEPLEDGNYHYRARSVFTQGGATFASPWSTPRSSIQDLTAPTIVLSAPNPATTLVPRPLLTGSIQDTNGISTATVSGTPLVLGANGSFTSNPVTLTPGETTTVNFVASDTAVPPNTAEVMLGITYNSEITDAGLIEFLTLAPPTFDKDSLTLSYLMRDDVLGASLVPEVSSDLKTWTPVVPTSGENGELLYTLPANVSPRFIRLRGER